MHKYLVKERTDCFIIWNHGLKYLDDIYNFISNSQQIKIILTKYIKVNNIKKFIEEIYKFDNSPSHHIKNKTKYLSEFKNHDVYCIFVRNKDVNEVWNNNYQLECLNIKKIKNKLRELYNPKINNQVSHNHVIHGTNSENEVIHLLKKIKFDEKTIKHIINFHDNVLDLEYNLLSNKNFVLRKVEISKLYGSEFVNEKSLEKKLVPLKETSINHAYNDKEKYQNYIFKNKFSVVKQYYSYSKFDKLKKNIKLNNSSLRNFIVIKKFDNEKYIVLDGLHRSIIQMNENKKDILACQILD